MARWIIRKIIQITILGLVLLCIGVIYVVVFVNPTHFKSQINDIIQRHSGYKIEVRGPIEWSFKPSFTIHLQDIALSSPQGFKAPFFVIKDAHVYMNFYSIFSPNLVIKKLEIDQMIATVERQEAGARNIDALPTVKAGSNERVTINELVITNSSLLYENEQTKRHWAINNASANIRTIVLNPFSTFGTIKVKGDLTQLDTNLTVNVDSTLNIDLAKKLLTFDPITITWNDAKLNGVASVAQYPSNPIYTAELELATIDLQDFITKVNPTFANSTNKLESKISGKTSFTYTEETHLLDVPVLEMTLDEGSIKGNSKISFAEPYLFGFDVNMHKVTLAPYIMTAHELLPIVMQRLAFTSPMTMIKQIELHGKISGTEVKLTPDFLLDQVTTDIVLDKGVLQLGPMLLRAYEGSHNCSITVDLTQATPTIKIVEQGNNVKLEPWISLLHLPKTINGTAELKLTLDGTGFTLGSLKETATGGLNLNVKNGSIHGLDLDKLMAYTSASINDILLQTTTNRSDELSKIIKLKSGDWISSQKANPTTTFEAMQLNSEIKTGLATTNINVSSTNYDISGNGKVNLTNLSVQMTTQATNKVPPTSATQEISKAMQQLPLSVTVTGTVDNLSFNPDLQSYITKITSKMQGNLINSAATKMVGTTGASAPTSKSAEAIFIDSLQGLKQ